MRRDATAVGQPVTTVRVTAARAYQQLLAEIAGTGHRNFSQGLDGYWSVGPTRYQRDGEGGLTASTVRNPCVGLVIRAARCARAAHGQRRDGLPHRR